jgi:PAS domain-containing protein
MPPPLVHVHHELLGVSLYGFTDVSSEPLLHSAVGSVEPGVTVRNTSIHFDEIWNKGGFGIAVLDNECRYQAINESLAQMHGISPEMHIGRGLKEVIGEVATQVEPALRRVFDTGTPVLNFTTGGRMPHRLIGHRWVCNYFPIRNDSGEVVQVAAIVVERQPDDDAKSIEPTGEQLGDTPPKGHILRSWKDIAAHMDTCVKTVQRWEHSYGLPVRRLAAIKGSVVFALKPEIDAWMLARTDQKQSVINEGNMHAVFTCFPAPALIIDDQRIIIHANTRALELIRVTKEELLGKNIENVEFSKTADYDLCECSLFQKSGKICGIRNFRRIDNTVFSAEYSMNRVAPGTNLVTFTVIHGDVAQREAIFFEAQHESQWNSAPLEMSTPTSLKIP